MKAKSHLANCDETAGYTDKEGAEDIIDLDFSTAFEVTFHRTFTPKLRKYGMNKLAVRSIENCLGRSAQWVATGGLAICLKAHNKLSMLRVDTRAHIVHCLHQKPGQDASSAFFKITQS